MKCNVLPRALIVCFPDGVLTSESVKSVCCGERFEALKGVLYLAKWKMKREEKERHQSALWTWAKNYRKVSQWDHTRTQTMNVLHTNTIITSLFLVGKQTTDRLCPCVSQSLWLLLAEIHRNCSIVAHVWNTARKNGNAYIFNCTAPNVRLPNCLSIEKRRCLDYQRTWNRADIQTTAWTSTGGSKWYLSWAALKKLLMNEWGIMACQKDLFQCLSVKQRQ